MVWDEVKTKHGSMMTALPVECFICFLTYVEFRDVEHFPPADHVLPLHEELQRVCPLSGRDELRAQEPGTQIKSQIVFLYVQCMCEHQGEIETEGVVLSQSGLGLCFVYDDRLGWRDEFRRLVAGKTTHGRGQETCK